MTPVCDSPPAADAPPLEGAEAVAVAVAVGVGVDVVVPVAVAVALRVAVTVCAVAVGAAEGEDIDVADAEGAADDVALPVAFEMTYQPEKAARLGTSAVPAGVRTTGDETG